MSLRCDSLYTFPKANPVPRWRRPVPTGGSWCWAVLVGESRCQAVPVDESWYQLVRVGTGWWNLVRLEMWVTIHVVVCRIVTHSPGLVQREQEPEGLFILARLAREGPEAGRDQERELCCYRDSLGCTQGWRDKSWISC
jgi:hypothetical protein